MKEQNDVVKLEFLLKLNENIVVQRYFNVRGYNPNARKSLELIEKYSKFWMQVIGTRLNVGKKTVNASTKFGELFEEI